MSVYTKLNKARMALSKRKLEKTGHNKFAGYNYFELGDFLIPTQEIFDEVGLCGVVSFSADLATLTITDTEDGSQIVLTSPMGSANLKGCHEVQNIGAVETYQRRYLWVSAMEIVEHDALDATTGKEKPETKQNLQGIRHSPMKGDVPPVLDVDRALQIKLAASIAVERFKKGDEVGAYEEVSGITDNEEKRYLWICLAEHSAVKAAIKKLAQADKEAIA